MNVDNHLHNIIGRNCKKAKQKYTDAYQKLEDNLNALYTAGEADMADKAAAAIAEAEAKQGKYIGMHLITI